MGIKCEEEFNPWPAFVDIFSAVILVLLLFLLVTLVNIGYYAQFKFKIQYKGSIATDELILQESVAKIMLDEEKNSENNSKKIATKNIKQQAIQEQAIQQQIIKELRVATDIESAGEDLADIKFDENEEATQTILEEDRFFFISYEDYKIHIGQINIKKFKEFVNKGKVKYPNAVFSIRAVEPLDIISATKRREISLGRTVSVRKLISKFDIENGKINLNLQAKPSKIPNELGIEYGLVVIELVNE